MKSTIIIDLIKGFFSKTPKRLKMFRNIAVLVAVLIAIATTLASNGVFVIPSWISGLISPSGIIGALLLAAGVNFAKEDINEQNK